MADRCFYFGCLNQAGHYMHGAGAGSWSERERFSYFGDHVHIDGSLAPRKDHGQLVWSGKGATLRERQGISWRSEEFPQGQFLRHDLDIGFTAIQWWDRTQGDTRSACNSTILLEGKHTSEEMIAALKEHFPHVLENLTKAGVQLVEVFP